MSCSLQGHQLTQEQPTLGIECSLPPPFCHEIRSDDTHPDISAQNLLTQLQSDQPGSFLPQFNWENKWLKGDEYSFMLQRIEEYCQLYNLQKYPKKTHPEDIYRSPSNGMVYFVEGNCVGSEFGFPRVPFRKQYRWKKMNFTTDLPKKHPQVTYIVASSVKCQKQSQSDKPETDIYRMHAVILYKQQPSTADQTNKPADQSLQQPNSSPSSKQYILCHIRKIDTLSENEKSTIVPPTACSSEKNSSCEQKKRKHNTQSDDSQGSNDNGDDLSVGTKPRKLKENTLKQYDFNGKSSVNNQNNCTSANISAAPKVNMLLLKTHEQTTLSQQNLLTNRSESVLKQSDPQAAVSQEHAINDLPQKKLSFQAARSSRIAQPFPQISDAFLHSNNLTNFNNHSNFNSNSIVDSPDITCQSRLSYSSPQSFPITFNAYSCSPSLISPAPIFPASLACPQNPLILNDNNPQLLLLLLQSLENQQKSINQQQQQQYQQQQGFQLMQQLVNCGMLRNSSDLNDLLLAMTSQVPFLTTQDINYLSFLNMNIPQQLNNNGLFLGQQNLNNNNVQAKPNDK